MLKEGNMLRISYEEVKLGNQVILNKNEVTFKKGISYIKGENGSGKTTFFNLLYGLVNEEQCNINIDGHLISKDKVELRNKYITYVTQKNLLFEQLSIEENINILCGYQPDIQKQKEVAEVLLFEKVHLRNPKVRKLSGGEKQKLKCMIAILTETSILLLDEPFNNLDSNSIDRLNKYLISVNKYLLITSHIELEAVPTYELSQGILFPMQQIDTDMADKSLLDLKNRVDEKQLDEVNIKKLCKINVRFRRSLYLINAIMVTIALIAVLNTFLVYSQATLDKSNFIFSDTSTLITPPLYNSYYSTFGSEKWLDKIPTYFSDEDIAKLEQLDYVAKVIPTKNRAYSVGGVSYKRNYQVDTNVTNSEFTFTSSLYSKDIASNIPISYFPTNDDTIKELLVGTFPSDKSDEVIIDTLVADYFLEELGLENYDQLIEKTIDVPVIEIDSGNATTLPFIVTGVFETEKLSEDESGGGTIVTSFDEENINVQSVYAQYQDPNMLLEHVQSRVMQAGLDENYLKSQMIPNPSYDSLYIEVEEEQDLKQLTTDLTNYDEYIEIENNYVNEKTLNFQYLSKVIYRNILVLLLLILIYIVVLVMMMKLMKQSLHSILYKLDFYAYLLEERLNYLNFELKEYILNVSVVNLVVSIFIQYFILNNFSIAFILIINSMLILINIIIVKLVVKEKLI